MSEQTPDLISFGRRIGELAAQHPDKTAMVFVLKDGTERHMSWQEFDQGANRMARLLSEHGVHERSMVAVGLPNGPEHFLVTHGAWRLGACVLPMRAAIPDMERDRVIQVADVGLVVADWDNVGARQLRAAELAQAGSLSDAPLPDRIAKPGKAIGSGGSTGAPKVTVDPKPWANRPGGYVGGLGGKVGMRTGQVQLIAGPLYHNGPFCWSHWGLFEDHTLIVMERFDASKAVDLIERYRVNFAFLVPTMMHRMIQLPDIKQRDFSCVHSLWHTAAPCPPWLKREWIALIGPERIFEAYGSTEGAGATSLRGDEWLLHPGSVGRGGADTDVRILDEEGNDVPANAVGEVFMRLNRAVGPTYYYLGSPPARSTPDGFISVGDLGWLDEEGYLYLADRRVDLIISGGANIYPAEVEAALTEHIEVADVAVIGLPDDEWGKSVHAIVQPRDPGSPPTLQELNAHCRERLTSYKVPKTYEFVETLPRDPSGKIRRSALVAEREKGWTPAATPRP